MKLKKLALIIVTILLALMILGMFNVSNAATGSKYLTIKLLRENGFGYKVLDKNVWKIVEAQDSSGNGISYDATIYCLKGGPGFGASDMNTASGGTGGITVKHYTRYFDMRKPEEIPSPYVEALPDVNSSTYKSLMWVLDHIYVAPSPTAPGDEKQEAQEFLNALLKEANLSGSPLTEEDIDAVQQLVVWHFTNTGDAYDVGSSQTFEFELNSIKGQEDSEFLPLSDENGDGTEDGWTRAEDAITLYRYFIANADPNYDYKKSASTPYELANLTQTVRTQGNSYVIGPFRIDRISDTVATLEGKFTNGKGETLNPTFQNASGTPFGSLEDTIGQEFYIVLPNTTDISEINFEINGS